MAKRTFNLGKGLESLIPTRAIKKIVPKSKGESIFNVEVHRIRPNPTQPRREFEKEGLKELAASIKRYGVLQPLLVTKVEQETNKGLDVEYELIAGERRWKAAKLAGLNLVPVIIKDDFNGVRTKLEVALVENLQREDLNPIEEAEAFKRLTEEFGLTQKDVADKVGKSREVITNSVRLLGLPANIKEALRAGKLMKTQARSLLALKSEPKQQEYFKNILLGKAVVRDIEAVAQTTEKTKTSTHSASAERFNELQENLSKNLSTVVFIKAGPSGGRIEIKFTNLEELNSIVKMILG